MRVRPGILVSLILLVSGVVHADEVQEATVRVGVTSAVSLPQPLLLGVRLRPSAAPDWESFFEGGWFRYGFGSGKRTLSTATLKGGARYHPFSNGWFVAGELGFRWVDLVVDISNLKLDGVSLADTAVARLGTLFGGLLVGGEWSVSDRLSLGFDLGVQLALLHAGSILIHAAPDQEAGTDNTVSDRKAMERISGLPLPQIAVLRLVWYL
jgi:hypothetical protein